MNSHKCKIIILFVLAFSLLSACDKFNDTKTESAFYANNGVKVSIDEAEDILLDIMPQIERVDTKSNNHQTKIISDRYTMQLNYMTKTGTEEEPNVHIFNFENNSGFAIMSGDKRTPSLLAYTFEGNLNEGDTIDNPGLAIFMSKLSDYYNNMCRDTIDSYNLIIDSTMNLEIVEMVNGFCPVKWFQRYPYNYYCPYDGDYLSYVGCVAVAVAQLMCTYRYPDSYDGYSFEWERMIQASKELNESLKPGPPTWLDTTVQIFHFPKSDSSNDVQLDTVALLQIARLMQLLGTKENLNIEYSAHSSSTSLDKVINALHNFGYSASGVYYKPKNQNEKYFVRQRVIEELKSGYYCIMAGSELCIFDSPIIPKEGSEGPEASSHCWLVHGFMSIEQKYFLGDIHPVPIKYDYLLCNFGWNSGDDGFYLYDVFDTEVGPVFDDVVVKSHEVDYGNYSSSLSYVIGIRK